MMEDIGLITLFILFLFLALCLRNQKNYSIFPWFRNLTEEQKKNIDFKYIKKYTTASALFVSISSVCLFLLKSLIRINSFYIFIAECCLIFSFLIVYVLMLKKSYIIAKWEFFSVICFLIFIFVIGLSKYF